MKGVGPAFLGEQGLRLVLFGGKGGVGKTTCAVAAALLRAHEIPGSRSLLVSTDPAHSLADALRNEPVPEGLTVLELDAVESLAGFLASNDATLREIATRGSLLSEGEIDSFLRLSLPGLDELMAFLEIASWLEDDRYARITVDTAPTGHTLRLLSTPGLLRGWLGALDALLAKHRYMRRVFGGSVEKDALDTMVESLETKVAHAEKILRDPAHCRFVPVTLAEPVCTAETVDLLEALRKAHIPVREVIVNRLQPDGTCPRRSAERLQQIGELGELAALGRVRSLSLWSLPALAPEPRGAAALGALWERASLLDLEPIAQRRKAGILEAPKERGEPVVVEGSFPLPDPTVELILLAGKGGVGKTTLACATALAMASLRPNESTLLLSTDPAHSLADALAHKVGDHPVPIGENLFALELDASKRLEHLRKGYTKDLKHFLSTVFKELDPVFDRKVLEKLIDLAPPGVDEVMALAEMADLLADRKYGLIVLDTAATGHLVRLLETPEIVSQWIKTIFDFLLSYRKVLHMPSTVKALVELSRGIKHFRSLVSDPARTALFVVTVPTGVAFSETRDLLDACERLEVSVRGIAINQATPPCDCEPCTAAREAEATVTSALQASAPGTPLATIPRCDSLRGIDSLLELGRRLFPGASPP